MLSLYSYLFLGRGGVRGCGGAALDRGPCLEGATSRPAAKSLPKGAKSYLKDNAGNRKRLGTVRHGRVGDTTHSPSTSGISCGRGFFLLFPYRWDFFPCVCRRPPPRSAKQKACDYAQGRGGHLNCLRHQWKTLFPSGKRGGHTARDTLRVPRSGLESIQTPNPNVAGAKTMRSRSVRRSGGIFNFKRFTFRFHK